LYSRLETINDLLIVALIQVAKRGLVVFRDQQDFIDRGPDFYREWGRHFGRFVRDDHFYLFVIINPSKNSRTLSNCPHLDCTSTPLLGIPKVILSYISCTSEPGTPLISAVVTDLTLHHHRDANATFNFEVNDSITSTVWHSDVSYELQPPGLTTFFLLAQPTTGGDTLFTSQVANLKTLSPTFVTFLRTLKAVHSGVEQAEFSRAGKRGGVVRREPVENVHPIVRKHPVTGEEALYVNRQFTRRIVGLKREESGW
jgi:sulfonate dioxygenase